MWAGVELVGEVADYAANLPRGGAVGQWLGGDRAITDEVESLWLIERAVYATNAEKPEKVQTREYPIGAREVAVKKELVESRAERFRREFLAE